MELQFEKTGWDCLTTVAAQVRGDEQTQEVRLPDNMPDIGKVNAAWGQVLVRGKEWRSTGMTVSGGIMAWVMYEVEDGSGHQTVETWIPFQLKWEFPETKRDGVILASVQLSGMDARSVSARKLLVRASVSAMGEALMPDTVEVYSPGAVPEDVQLLKQSYPVRIPREAGEKAFELEEELSVPGSAGQISKLLRYSLEPEVTDGKVMAGKVVFRGIARLHILFEDLEGRLRTWDQEVNFSQFGDLERDYDQDTQVRLVAGVTNLELDVPEPDRLSLKAGLVGQYVISDRPVLEVVEDAYSNRRTVTPKHQMLMLPVELDSRSQVLRLEESSELDADRIVDTAFLISQPRQSREPEKVELEQSGSFQLLYYDRAGALKGKVISTEEDLSIPADGSSTVTASSSPTGQAQATAGSNVTVRGDALISTVTTTDQGIPMVTALELGELTQPDPDRPSMILRRAGDRRLWDLAKESRSTVEAICQVNHLQGEPEEDCLLLIPVS